MKCEISRCLTCKLSDFRHCWIFPDDKLVLCKAMTGNQLSVFPWPKYGTYLTGTHRLITDSRQMIGIRLELSVVYIFLHTQHEVDKYPIVFIKYHHVQIYLWFCINSIQASSSIAVPEAYVAVSCASSTSEKTWLPRAPGYCLVENNHSI